MGKHALILIGLCLSLFATVASAFTAFTVRLVAIAFPAPTDLARDSGTRVATEAVVYDLGLARQRAFTARLIARTEHLDPTPMALAA